MEAESFFITNLDKGRVGVGAVNHCAHGNDNETLLTVLDWRPFDYYTEIATMPPSMGGIKFTSTYELVPTTTGTTLTFRVGQPKKASDRQILGQIGPFLEQAFAASIKSLADVTGEEAEQQAGDRIEPDLPQPKNADGFLEVIQPIQYVG